MLSGGRKVMYAAAITLARDNNIPILVFSIHQPGAFAAVVGGGGHCTVIGERAGDSQLAKGKDSVG